MRKCAKNKFFVNSFVLFSAISLISLLNLSLVCSLFESHSEPHHHQSENKESASAHNHAEHAHSESDSKEAPPDCCDDIEAVDLSVNPQITWELKSPEDTYFTFKDFCPSLRIQNLSLESKIIRAGIDPPWNRISIHIKSKVLLI